MMMMLMIVMKTTLKMVMKNTEVPARRGRKEAHIGAI